MFSKLQVKSSIKSFIKLGLFLTLSLLVGVVFGEEGKGGIGQIAKNVTGSFAGLIQLMLGVGYVAGVGFAVAAIFKFKQHKDNPTQIPLGTPIALLAIAISLIFIAYFIKPLGETLGASEESTGGPTGEVKLPGMKK